LPGMSGLDGVNIMIGRLMKVLIFIPAYNEQATIKGVVNDLVTHCPEYDYIVINDGSTDDTEKICRENGFPCISLPVNLGLDGVFQTGIRYAKYKGYDIAMPFDGDGQHNAEYIKPMIEKMLEGYDIVVGSRFLNNKKHTNLRVVGSSIISFCFFIATGSHMSDPTSGMRMVNKKMIRALSQNLNLGPEPDTWAYLVRNKARMAEVHVEMNDRMAGTSYFTLGKSIAFMTRMCVSILFILWFRKKVTE
jgi:glycosyltransferase involved in cell wall biosynthesis